MIKFMNDYKKGADKAPFLCLILSYYSILKQTKKSINQNINILNNIITK